MAFNNYGYPYGMYQNYGQQYQQPYQVQYQQPAQTQVAQSPQDERIWVTGESSAQAYLVAPNGFVRLWDSTADRFYEKHADSTGKPSMEVYEYKRLGAQEPPAKQTVEYETRIKDIEDRLDALESKRRSVKEADKDEQ